MLNPQPNNVDVVVLSRNYFKEPQKYDVDLGQLTSSLHVRFLSNTQWLEDCLKHGKKLDLEDYRANEILPPASGGVIVLEVSSQNGNSQICGVDPSAVGRMASLIREEKRQGSKWKVMAPLAALSTCGGVLEGLDGVVEVLKRDPKSASKAAGGNMDFMLGVREAHAARYRHVLLLVSSKDQERYRGGAEMGARHVDRVVTVVDAFGLSAFAQGLRAQRKDTTSNSNGNSNGNSKDDTPTISIGDWRNKNTTTKDKKRYQLDGE